MMLWEFQKFWLREKPGVEGDLGRSGRPGQDTHDPTSHDYKPRNTQRLWWAFRSMNLSNNSQKSLEPSAKFSRKWILHIISKLNLGTHLGHAYHVDLLLTWILQDCFIWQNFIPNSLNSHKTLALKTELGNSPGTCVSWQNFIPNSLNSHKTLLSKFKTELTRAMRIMLIFSWHEFSKTVLSDFIPNSLNSHKTLALKTELGNSPGTCVSCWSSPDMNSPRRFYLTKLHSKLAELSQNSSSQNWTWEFTRAIRLIFDVFRIDFFKLIGLLWHEFSKTVLSDKTSFQTLGTLTKL